MLSPTRTYAPILNEIFSNQKLKSTINGIIHCTGGAQTKVMKFLDKSLFINKTDMLNVPPLFKTIQETTETSDKEMYEVFNMGHRLEVYCPSASASELIDIAAKYNIDAKVIGKCVKSEQPKLEIQGIQY